MSRLIYYFADQATSQMLAQPAKAGIEKCWMRRYLPLNCAIEL
jgi:hypothetical protein